MMNKIQIEQPDFSTIQSVLGEGIKIMRKTLIACSLLLTGQHIFAQSTAHDLSKSMIIDPTYNSTELYPFPDIKIGTPWIYGYAELESWKLQVLRKEVKEAKLLVGYPGSFHTAYQKVSFKLQKVKGVNVNTLIFRAVGDVSVLANEKVIYTSAAKEGTHVLKIPKGVLVKRLQIDLVTTEEPGGLLITDGPFATSNRTWQWKSDKELWQQAYAFPQTKTNKAPHRQGLISESLVPISNQDGMHDFGSELFGYINITSSTMPEIGIGESKTEAADTVKKTLEQSNEMIKDVAGKWRSKFPVAFRYIKIYKGTVTNISCDALFHPAQYKGAFASSDSVLNQIWMNSAYTLRLCMRDFLIDGIKRDRLPWTGDLAMSLQANAYTFADKELVRRTLLVLGRAGIMEKDVNGIIDYSLWWIICQDLYQLYYGDPVHLKREWPRIKDALNVLNSRCNNQGFLDPKDTWLFIDWADGNKNSTLQILWWWAQQSAIKLAARVNDRETAEAFTKQSGLLQKQLLLNCWNDGKGAWMDDPYLPANISRHANLMAVVSGLAGNSQYPQIEKVLKGTEAIRVGTPYMAGFENMALSRLGASHDFVSNVKDYWGGMLSQGATTFWEGYNPAEKGKEMYAFYNRPYAKSLCHAWSAGPAAFLPAELLGIRPLEDGWSVFSINPKLGAIENIDATVPTPHGAIIVAISNSMITVEIPAGTTAKYKGKLFKGPYKLSTGI